MRTGAPNAMPSKVFRLTLRQALLRPLAVVGMVLCLVVPLIVQKITADVLTERLLKRVADQAILISDAAQLIGSTADVQRLIALAGADRDILSMAIASGTPALVIAATRSAWLGQPADELLTAQIGSDAREAPAIPGVALYYSDAAGAARILAVRSYQRNPVSLNEASDATAVLLVEIDASEEQSLVARSSRGAFVITFLVLLVLLASITLSVEGILLAPLKRIDSAVRRRAAGDTLLRLEAERIPEYQQLAESLNEAFRQIEVLDRARDEREQAMRNLLREHVVSERRLSLAMEVSRLYVFEYDLQSRTTYVSDSVFQVLGYSPEELLEHAQSSAGQDEPALFGLSVLGATAEDQSSAQDSVYRALSRSEASHNVPRSLLHRDGHLIDAVEHIVPVRDANAIVTGLLGVVRDVSVSRQTETRLRSLLAISGAVLYTANLDDYAATFVSDGVTAVTGYSAHHFLEKADFWIENVHPDDRPTMLANLEALERVDHHIHEYRFRRRDGGYRWLRDELTLVRNVTGQPVEIVGFWFDITDRKENEERIRELQKLDAIGQLTGGLAHDFNNLLGLVVGNLDLIEERLPEGDTKVRRQFDTARDAALRGAEVTRSLLAVARRQPMEVAGHDVNDLLREMLPLMRASAGSSVGVQLNLMPGTLAALIDAGGLSNAILNLVINARDAMQDKDKTSEHHLLVSTRLESVAEGADAELAPGQYVIVEVKDNGKGMPSNVLAQVFDPFFTTKERGKGTGLGLSMVRGYAKQLGGAVKIQSVQGFGTTVSVYLPGSTGPTSDVVAILAVATPIAVGVVRDQASASGTARRVLVVDDEKGLSELACVWLESLGYEVASAHSAEEALELLASATFDILFTDVMMPGVMDGIALARLAQQRQPQLSVLLTSGYARALIEAPVLPGMLLNKPYRKKDLERAMAAVQGLTS